MKKKRGILTWLLLTLMLLVGSVTANADEMKVHFLDVGQGLSILVQCDGQNMIYDGGDRSTSSYVVSYLKDQGVETIDYLVSSHYDSDHMAGLIGCLNAFDVKNVIGSDYVHDSDLYTSFMDAVASKGLEVQHPAVGDTFQLGNATLEVLGPVNISSDSNNNSVAIKLTNDDDSFLFTGDAEAAEEAEMIGTGIDLNCEVLVLGHHGSDTSSSWDFLSATAPAYAVISCGKDNQYGHPHADTLEKMQSMDIDIFRTDDQGTIVATSNGATISFNVEPSADYTTGDGQTVGQTEAVQEETQAPQTEVTQADPGDGQLVWLSATGSKYHSRNNCGRMNPDKAYQVTQSEAEAQGYGRCSKCW